MQNEPYLNVHAPVRMRTRAPTAAVMTSAVSPVVASTVVSLLALVLPGGGGGGVIAMDPGDDGGHEEEDAVHDTEGKTRLEHRARLVNGDIKAVDRCGTKNAKANVQRVASGDVGTISVGDEPQVVDGSNEGADKADVDKGDELRVRAAPVVAE